MPSGTRTNSFPRGLGGMAFSEFPNSAREHYQCLDVSSIRVARPSRLHKAHLTSARRPFWMDMSDSSALAIASLYFYLVPTEHLSSPVERVRPLPTNTASISVPIAVLHMLHVPIFNMACIASKLRRSPTTPTASRFPWGNRRGKPHGDCAK